MPEFHWIDDQVCTVSDFLSPAECQRHIELAEKQGFEDAPINTAFGPQRRPEVRNNRRVMVDDRGLAAELWELGREYVPGGFRHWEAIGLNERFRYYRYDVGQQFEWHYDGCFERINGERSLVTFMVYLNEGFEGGETIVDQARVEPREGMALFFAHRILHKGMPVIAGRKYVLRTDVMFRRRNPEADAESGAV